MAGEADQVDSWFSQAFGNGTGGGYGTVQGNGVAATQRTVLDLEAGSGISVTVIDDAGASPPRTKATIAATGAGSGGGPTVLATIYSSAGPTTVPRSSAWMRVKVGTGSNAVSLKADASCVENDQIDFVDVDRAFGTHALTFDGNGHQVEDPWNSGAPLAPTFTTPALFSDMVVSWQLLKNSAGTLYWKAV